MAVRVQGGTRGLLCALDCGRVDELNAELPEDRARVAWTIHDKRSLARRMAREKRVAGRAPF